MQHRSFPRRVAGKLKRNFFERTSPPVVRSVRRAGLTFLGPQDLTELWKTVRSIEDAGVAGIAIEAGCALGGSAIVIASAKAPTRPMLVFDTFEGIPPPSDEDGDDVRERYAVISSGRAEGLATGDTYYGYHEDLFDEVRHNFAIQGVPTDENRVTLVRGLFQDTMEIADPVAFVHLDSDWYESTTTALERTWPHVSVGGVVVIDDYDAWSGCRRAVDEYFADRHDYRMERHLRPHFVRTRPHGRQAAY